MSAIPILDEEECYLAAILDDASGVELAEFCWIDEENDDGCYRLWDFQWVWYRCEDPFQIDHCIAEGELVLTRRGHVPIEEVLVGDAVWTHENRWRPVMATWDRGVRDVVDVTNPGNPAGLCVTRDHEMWARNGTRRMVTGQRSVRLDEPAFIAPEDFRVRQGEARATMLASPHVFEPAVVPAVHRRPNCNTDSIPTDLGPDFLWLCGMYVAEGSIHSSSKQPVLQTILTVHESEAETVQLAAQKCGLKARIEMTANPKVRTVILPGRSLATWLIEHFGRHASGKGLPVWALGLPEWERQGLLDGLMYGDGHTRPSGRGEYTTVSKALAYDVRLLIQSLGRGASVALKRSAGQMVIQGRTVDTRDTYSVDTWVESPTKSREIARDEHVWAAHYGCVPAGRRHVYDLTVEEDHSFVVNGQVVSNCGRSVGKSVGIQMRAFAFPFNHPGAEMLITAPELNHLRPVTDKVEHLFRSTRLGQAMLPQRSGNGINHQPQFQAHFINDSRIVSRLPNRDGRGVKGQHPLVIEMDEGQDYPDNGWTELIETMKHGSPGAQWRIHGVSRGIRDKYYRFTMGEDPDMPFTVHRYMAMHRPTWGAKERKSKIAIYGGTEDNVDYRRNIYGEHGDATNPVFVLARLMANVRINENAWATKYNDEIYTTIKINDELLRSSGAPIEAFLQLPGNHLTEEYTSYWGGMDVGFTRDPSEILIAGVTKHPTQKNTDLLRILARIHLMRVSAADQAEAVRVLFAFYGIKLKCLAMDRTGNGLPLWQMLDPAAVGTHVDLRRTPDHISQRIRGYNFSSKVAVEFDDRELKGRETQIDAVIERNIVDFATDELRKVVDAGQIELPYDRELLSEWQGQEIQYVRDEGSAAGNRARRYGGGSFHTLDAAKMLIAGKSLQAIEAAMNVTRKVEPRLARFN